MAPAPCACTCLPVFVYFHISRLLLVFFLFPYCYDDEFYGIENINKLGVFFSRDKQLCRGVRGNREKKTHRRPSSSGDDLQRRRRRGRRKRDQAGTEEGARVKQHRGILRGGGGLFPFLPFFLAYGRDVWYTSKREPMFLIDRIRYPQQKSPAARTLY